MLLKDALSPLEAGMRQMQELLTAEQIEIDKLIATIENLYRGLYVKSSGIEEIEKWEDEYAILHDDTLTIEQRRSQVLAKINSGRTATREMLENLVKQILGANSVSIIEYPEEYRFVIYIGTDYFEEHMSIADAAVGEARPAHLAYKFINQLYRIYRCNLYVGMMGCVRSTVIGEVDTYGLKIDKLRCGLYFSAIGCSRKIAEGWVR